MIDAMLRRASSAAAGNSVNVNWRMRSGAPTAHEKEGAARWARHPLVLINGCVRSALRPGVLPPRHVSAAQHLLDGLHAVPPAGEPHAAGLVLDGDADRVGAARLAAV